MADTATVAQPAIRTLCFIFILIPFVCMRRSGAGTDLSEPAGIGRNGAWAPRKLVHDMATCARRSRPECLSGSSGEADGRSANVNANVNEPGPTLIIHEDLIKARAA
jgi:hypothetical protein